MLETVILFVKYGFLLVLAVEVVLVGRALLGLARTRSAGAAVPEESQP